MRSLVERTTHRVVMKRRLPPPFPPVAFYVSSEGGLRYLRRSVAQADPALLRAATELVRPGDVVWDIGANVGLFSFAAAALAGGGGQVVAVEADTWLTDLLRRSARLDGPARAPVTVLPVAVSNEVGISAFHVARRARATSYLDGLGTTQTGGVRETQVVPTVTLDWLAGHFPPPDVLKIDVEGAELLVLQGGPEVLARRPRLVCEVLDASSGRVGALLGACGYQFFDATHDRRSRAPVSKPPDLTLALPR
ncbi:MAG TPA: FkbM family methyltransferase [Acidimicrobiales bacterium]|nr:FkbM family methyltransferase [Acidimicrobiales bacterium]